MSKRTCIAVMLSASLSGAAAMILEITGAHALAPGFGTGIYTWAAMISVAMGSLALGYAMGGFFASRRQEGLATHVLPAILAIAGLGFAFDAALWYMLVQTFSTKGPRLGAAVASISLFMLPFSALGAAYPAALRIWTLDIKDVGWRSGLLSAGCAVGSLAGAVVAGFLLVPNLPIDLIFAGCSAALLLAAAAILIISFGSKAAAAAAIIAASLVTLVPASPRDSYVACRRSSQFGPVEVVDRGDAMYFVVSGAIQGGMWKGSRTSVFTYVQEIGETLRSNLSFPGAEVLLIGLGAGLLPRTLEPGTVTTVEVDPVILEIARDYFGLDSSLHPVIIGDGRASLSACKDAYDAIVLDAYGGGSHPSHLLTREFFELVRDRLKKDGFFLVNFQGFLKGDGAQFACCLEKTLRAVFREVWIHGTEDVGEFANVMFVAGGAGRDFSWPMGGYTRRPSFPEDGKPSFELTDSRNAIQAWNASIEYRWRAESDRTLGRGR